MRKRERNARGWSRALKDGASWTESDAREVLAECTKSGETIVDFARREGIAPTRLYRWKHILKSRGTRAAGGLLIPVTVREVPIVRASGPRFAERGDDPVAVVVDVSNGELRVAVAETNAVSPEWVATLVKLVREGT
jgi:transposase-like protein